MRAFAPVILLFALAGPVAADHCETWTTSHAELDAAGAYYVAVDCTPVPFLFPCISPPLSVWIYEESNGIPGLQRADEMLNDTCHGMIASDTIVF